MTVVPEFEVEWQSDGRHGETPVGRVTFVEADDLAGAVWEATRLLRAKVQHERAAINAGLYGNGFTVREAA